MVSVMSEGISPRDVAKADQGFSALAEMFPPHWRRVFNALEESGFTEEQSMRILDTYIMATLSGRGG